MPRQKQQPAIPTAKRRWLRFFLWTLLLFLLASAFYSGGGRLHWPGMASQDKTLSELLASEKYRGFELVQEPDRPGPYQDIGIVGIGRGQPAIGSFWVAGRSRRFSIRAAAGEERSVVGLAPEAGGEPTFMVLRPRAAVK